MSLNVHQWYNFHERVLDLWNVFVSRYASDTGSIVAGATATSPWICADSGDSKYATEAERLRVIAAAHAPVNLQGSPLARDSVVKLRLMARGGSLPTDTGSS